MVGGSGEQKDAASGFARYADACNLFADRTIRAEQTAAKLEVLARHCALEGTDYGGGFARRSFGPARWSRPPPVARLLLEQMAAYADVGIEEVHVMPFTTDPVAFVEGLGEHVVRPDLLPCEPGPHPAGHPGSARSANSGPNPFKPVRMFGGRKCSPGNRAQGRMAR
jgi:hypothetical protein